MDASAQLIGINSTHAITSCHNCGRATNAEFNGVVAQDVYYCSSNCFWSEKLDVTNSRLRRKKRGGPRPARRVRTRQVAEFMEDAAPANSDSSDSMIDSIFPPVVADDALALYAFCPSNMD